MSWEIADSFSYFHRKALQALALQLIDINVWPLFQIYNSPSKSSLLQFELFQLVCSSIDIEETKKLLDDIAVKITADYGKHEDQVKLP